ncbi:MAG: hypothetical protein ACFE9Q_17235 [Candidatus Hodarchaeota archaeon]
MAGTDNVSETSVVIVSVRSVGIRTLQGIGVDPNHIKNVQYWNPCFYHESCHPPIFD